MNHSPLTGVGIGDTYSSVPCLVSALFGTPEKLHLNKHESFHLSVPNHVTVFGATDAPKFRRVSTFCVPTCQVVRRRHPLPTSRPRWRTPSLLFWPLPTHSSSEIPMLCLPFLTFPSDDLILPPETCLSLTGIVERIDSPFFSSRNSSHPE
jgi:hypothetical protein